MPLVCLPLCVCVGGAQLTIELYSELIFLGLSLRSAVWWLMVLTEAAVVLLKYGHLAMNSTYICICMYVYVCFFY
jgi:hypothetical protein